MKRWFAAILACAMLLSACALVLAEGNGGAASDSAGAEILLDEFVEFVQDALDAPVELKKKESGDGYIFETTTEEFQIEGSAGGADAALNLWSVGFTSVEGHADESAFYSMTEEEFSEVTRNRLAGNTDDVAPGSISLFDNTLFCARIVAYLSHQHPESGEDESEFLQRMQILVFQSRDEDVVLGGWRYHYEVQGEEYVFTALIED